MRGEGVERDAYKVVSDSDSRNKSIQSQKEVQVMKVKGPWQVCVPLLAPFQMADTGMHAFSDFPSLSIATTIFSHKNNHSSSDQTTIPCCLR
jgi:hypothetical protein